MLDMAIIIIINKKQQFILKTLFLWDILLCNDVKKINRNISIMGDKIIEILSISGISGW